MNNPVIVSVPFNYSAVTCDTVQYASSRYERYENYLVLIVDAINQEFKVTNVAAGGSVNISFQFPRYGWLINGVERASYKRVGTERVGTLVGKLGSEADGLTKFELVGYNASGAATQLMTHFGYIDRQGKARDDLNTVVQTASRDWETRAILGSPGIYQYAIVPKKIINTTRVKPLASRYGVPFNTVLPAAMLTRIDYVIPSDGVPNTPCVSLRGITVTENLQPYHWTRLIDKEPSLPLLDGPRGVCTTPFTTALLLGRNGKVYGANPWQVWVMDATGTKRTLFGLRHKYQPVWTEAALTGPEVEWVGAPDLSIPPLERFAWECWGMAWDARTLAIDPAQPLIDGAPPHIGLGPVLFLSDRHGFVLKLQFDGHDRAVPPKVTRWCAVDDAWGIACDNAILYVAERGRDRIIKISADTGAFLGVFAGTDKLGLGAVAATTRLWVGAGNDITRNKDCVAPEGLLFLDGFVYWGSLAQGQVRRKKTTGGAIEVCVNVPIDNNSNYVYLTISDGNFGPRGTLFTTTWSIANFGRPIAHLPGAGLDADGVTQVTHSKKWVWQGFATNVLGGPGGKWASDGYGSAVAVGRTGSGLPPGDPTYGVLACTSSSGNLSMYMQTDLTLDGPTFDYAKAKRGGDWYRLNKQVLHGAYCAGPNLPLPWGENPDCDYFMSAICGYVLTDYEDPIVIAELQATITTLTTQIDTLQADRDAQKLRADTADTAKVALQAKIDAARVKVGEVTQALA